ncbi:MAG: HEAT repeat domain-containing protein [Candidatus Riflebacteria bacterium]|nr:HEAT repeat domain-containing protein [Candidatus Riflebacteria bacterium]
MADQALKMELWSKDKSIRLQAIENIIQEPPSSKFLELLSSRKEVEKDSECLRQLELAFLLIEKRCSGKADKGILTREEFLLRFENADSRSKVLLMDSIKPEQLKEFSSELPHLLKSEKDPAVLVSLFRTFINVFPVDALRLASRHLIAESLSLRMATIELLIKKAPESLRRDLPKLLVHHELRIRTLAIIGLSKIDNEEALNHLGLLLESGLTESIIAGIQNSIFFPFSSIKPMVLRALAMVDDTEVLLRFGVLIENNPDPEMPFRLWEILESSSENKKKILQVLLKNCCINIEKSGILGDSFSEYYERLKHWIKRRKIVFWLRELLSSFDSDSSALLEVDSWVKEKKDDPLVKEILTEALQWQISDKAREYISGCFENDQKAPDQKPLEEKPTDFNNLSHDEKARKIVSWSKGANQDELQILKNILTDQKSLPDLQAIALKTAIRLKLKEHVAVARDVVQSKNQQLAISAMEYLGEYDFDWLFPFLGKFLQSDLPRVKGTAIKILNSRDKQQALSSVRAMLNKRDIDSHKAALICLIHFDFVAIRDILYDYLRVCDSAEPFSTALFFFNSNPDSENLFVLYSLEKHLINKSNLDDAKKVYNTRMENYTILHQTQQISIATWKESEEILEKRFQEAEARKKTPPADYSVKTLSKESVQKSFYNYVESLLPQVKYFFSENSKIFLYIALVAFGYQLFLLIPAVKTPEGRLLGNQLISVVQYITGEVLEVNRDWLSLKGTDGKIYFLSPKPGIFFKNVPVGTKLKISYLPYRINESEQIRGQCLDIQVP